MDYGGITFVSEFEYASMSIIAVLLVIFFLRRRPPTWRSSIAYITMLIAIFASAVLNIASAWDIRFSCDEPLWLSYLIQILYYLVYNLLPFLFLLFVASLCHRTPLTATSLHVAAAGYAIELLLIVTTPWTHLIFYFDESKNYLHGPVLNLLLVIAFALVVYSGFLYVRYRRESSRLRMAPVIFFVAMTLAAAFVQFFNPWLLIGNYAASLSMIALLVVVQNPADYIDNIADCYNSNAFYLMAEINIEHGWPFTAAVIHVQGLEYLRSVATAQTDATLARYTASGLRRILKTNDVYHLGGYRFAVYIDERKGVTEESIVERMRAYASNPQEIFGASVSIAPKICFVRYPDFVKAAEDMRDAVSHVVTRSLGEDGMVFVADEKDSNAKRRQARILNSLHRCIATSGFEVYYQPIYCPAKGCFVSAEALVRMIDDELGFVGPDEFIALAERRGLMVDVGEQVFQKACSLLNTRRVQELGVEYIEVNLSIMQCAHEGLADSFTQIMHEYDIAPAQVNFEVTETASHDNRETLLENMEWLISLGSSFSLDDYGTGFSTANYLVALPFKLVKIDKSILWPAMEDDAAMAILRHTIEMLKDLGKEVLVEGVETAEMAELLTDMGCDYLQGFFYSKPVPEDDFIAFLEEHSQATD